MMYPYERSLVERLASKPFALIGVNSDQDREKLKEVLKKEKITWRSFWNGGSPMGPIARQYSVNSWPSIYLIDAKGVIRHVDLHGPELDQAIDKLIGELETANGKSE
jgi:thioredoxin family protein